MKSVAQAGVRNAQRLAKLAHEETGFGVEADKVIKNVFASDGVYQHIKDMKNHWGTGTGRGKKNRTIAVPVGVIAGLIPSTNPTSTALCWSRSCHLSGKNPCSFLHTQTPETVFWKL